MVKVKLWMVLLYKQIFSLHLSPIMTIFTEIMKDLILEKSIGFQDPRLKCNVKLGENIKILFMGIIIILVDTS